MRKSNFKYYKLPNVKKKKIIGVADIILSVVLIIAISVFFPLELFAGIGDSGKERSEAISEYMNENTVKAGYVAELFRTSTVQNGGSIQYDSDSDSRIEYGTRMLVKGYHKVDNWLKSSHSSAPKGIVLYYEEILISVVDGYAYVDCFGGTYGKSATDVSSTFIGEDGKVDYRAVYDLLSKNDTEPITYTELASLYALMRDNVLIGYCDGVAWFGEKADGETKVMQVTADEITHRSNVAWEIDEIHVINNSFVFYRSSNEAWITTLEDNTYQAIGVEKDAASWGKVLQLGYGVAENGDKTHTYFFTMTENKLFVVRATGTTTAGCVTKTFERDKDLGELCVLVEGKNAVAWIENGKDYNTYSVYGE